MKLLDVGGGVRTHPDATHIIDIRPKPKDCKIEYVQSDVCGMNWPFKDKEFDYVYCSNLLEDVKDPLFVCHEMMRVGKAGRIIVPSVITECRIGIDVWPKADKYAGYIHHKWLCFVQGEGIVFVQKTPLTHIYDWTKYISEDDKRKCFYSKLDWKNSFKPSEHTLAVWSELYDYLKQYFGIDPKEEEKNE